MRWYGRSAPETLPRASTVLGSGTPQNGGDAVVRGEAGDRAHQESSSEGTEPQVDFFLSDGYGLGTTRKGGNAMSAKMSKGFTDEERAAMRERAKELKAEARANKNRAAGENDLLAKIAEMQEPDRAMAKRLHEIVKASAPALSPKTWYGMPAYANKDGKVVCYFQGARKFNSRYATLGFNDEAKLDEGGMWPTSFALRR